MEYVISKFAQLAGISTRTLRHYDQIGLLKPLRVTDNGYRVYGPEQVDRLQQILLYRELDMELGQIKRALDDAEFSIDGALEQHRRMLHDKRDRLERIIQSIDKTINARKEERNMSDREKFEGFKMKLIDENEQTYGAEIRGKYGDKEIEESNCRLLNMTEGQYVQMKNIGEELQRLIESAVQNGDAPEAEKGSKAAELHRNWLCYTWTKYSAQAHKNLAQMYIDDERFTKHYDKDVKGCAKFLRDAIQYHV